MEGICAARGIGGRGGRVILPGALRAMFLNLVIDGISSRALRGQEAFCRAPAERIFYYGQGELCHTRRRLFRMKSSMSRR